MLVLDCFEQGSAEVDADAEADAAGGLAIASSEPPVLGTVPPLSAYGVVFVGSSVHLLPWLLAELVIRAPESLSFML